jgi:hypothetical protein
LTYKDIQNCGFPRTEEYKDSINNALNDFGVKEEANKLLRPRYDSPKAESRI